MMIHQQTMLASTIKPMSTTAYAAANRSSSSKQSQQRAVMFSSCTKDSSSSSRSKTNTTPMQRKRRSISSSVPIPDALFRSPSEVQLSLDEQMADERDFIFYARLISGIRERTNGHDYNDQQYQQHQHYNEETERCLTHIMQTRYQEQREEQGGVPIQATSAKNEGGYYLDDLDCFYGSSCSSSASSSSSYQQEFEQNEHDLYDDGENDCMFDLEL
mmetsp:Transcript_26341/g.57717  ORF Transcript_26341/g.57717 Transcript_26341/m.57717 type:complete len:216 (+) Transcript_26341:167-814(+)|eukprot:CAMPEP_0168180228 /NCGR_PEP_ID=MMETSP0139_2-20121125/10387_1 /TAXON_ID=44445 /ORGANISM="Pseudo-nitzschia australis, Strain 10249 10 AB" /LENGTH=215 /DNA_ID=CAMNT_0008100355 /DNA_START=118 /DNA_END=765 /DNA_ORIENTATION=+